LTSNGAPVPVVRPALNWQQSALLAGLVQPTSSLNPYTNPDGALQRRNVVLDTMIENLPQHADELRAAKAEPLGVLPRPNELPGGCIAAGDRAFFCDYVLDYLTRAGISKEQVARSGYLIRTTLDPKVQTSVKSAVDKGASPTLDGVASVMSVIKPGKDAHRVMAMASNRTCRHEARRTLGNDRTTNRSRNRNDESRRAPARSTLAVRAVQAQQIRPPTAVATWSLKSLGGRQTSAQRSLAAGR
jgi:membrane peptidoglycan carboxypeptidase